MTCACRRRVQAYVREQGQDVFARRLREQPHVDQVIQRFVGDVHVLFLAAVSEWATVADRGSQMQARQGPSVRYEFSHSADLRSLLRGGLGAARSSWGTDKHSPDPAKVWVRLMQR